MRFAVLQIVLAVGTATLLYFAVTNTIYLLFAAFAGMELRRHRRRRSRRDFDVVRLAPSLPAISVVVPAFNEERTIVDSVTSLLTLDYPSFEIIVVNDGSTDGTLASLRDAFDLVRVVIASGVPLPCAPVAGTYRSLAHATLTVVDKANAGKADSVNAGIAYARSPLVCAVDADSLLEEHALLRMVQPFLADPSTIASGGIIRVANNCVVREGRIVQTRLPRHILPLFQSVEYLRAFLAARVTFSRARALLIISGAFGLFRRDALIEVGGFDCDTVGEDMEIVTRLHRAFRESARPYRIVFLPDPVCWTQVPETASGLARQRNRWQRGTLEVLWQHRSMIGNPRYGVVGMIAMPYFLFFEALAPVIESSGHVVTLTAVAFGALDWRFAWLLFLTAVVYGSFVSVSAVLLQESSRLRDLSLRELGTLVIGSLAENFGYRQTMAFWRLKGTVDFLRGEGGWGKMRRRRFRRQ